MSFPASGFESFYRNSISDVQRFLDEKHNGNYLVFNMSGRDYNKEHFFGKVEDYDWEDHHSPCIDVLFRACDSMYKFLMQDPENVIVVHCNAGKGRTGTVISCFFIYSGLCASAEDASKYYGVKRF